MDDAGVLEATDGGAAEVTEPEEEDLCSDAVELDALRGSLSSNAAARRSIITFSISSALAIVAFSGGSAAMFVSACIQSSSSCWVCARRR